MLENISYVKLAYRNQDSTRPDYFYIMRLSWKLPLVTIRVAFLGGTAGSERQMVITYYWTVSIEKIINS